VAYRITEECLACGICMDECPNSAIGEGDDIMVIDPKVCDSCGSCLQVCPNEAIVEE